MMRRWLLLMMLVLTTADSFGQVKRYDTDFFVSQRNFLFAVPLEVERGQLYVTLDFNGSRTESVARFYAGFGTERYTYSALNFCNNKLLALPVRFYKLLKNNILK